jgi:uncharacterized membrane protein YphA (DoxX/SURF4 family)
MEALKLSELESAPAPAPAAWPLWVKVSFRFWSIYFFLHMFPQPLGWLHGTDTVARWFHMPVYDAAAWIGRHVYGMTRELSYQETGSGDTSLDYIRLSMIVILTVVGTAAWSIVDRRRPNHDRLHRWMRVYLRYGLGIILLTYGVMKLFKGQFPDLMLYSQYQRYGNSSPMRLLWNFMGYSTPYTMFTGGVETLGGLLLLFRRTTLVGALVGALAMANVAILNFCYDVPVKLFSTLLLGMAIYLLAPELRGLFRFLVLRRATERPELDPPPFARRWMNRAALGLKAAFVLYILAFTTWESYQAYRSHGPGAPKPALYGMYEVDDFTRDGEVLAAPTATTTTIDTRRWRMIGFDRSRFLFAVHTDGQMVMFRIKSDDGATLRFHAMGTPDQELTATYRRPDPDHIVFEGEVEGGKLSATAHRIPDPFLLTNRGFHWVNEYPFNR